MKMKKLLPLGSVILLVLGVTAAVLSYGVVTMPPDLPELKEPQVISGSQSPDPLKLDLDISASLAMLDELPEGARCDQLADWALYGALYHWGAGAEDIRDATYTLAPWRDPAMERVYRFEYGPGRHLIRPRGEVWLFYPERQKAKRQAILGRLADRSRVSLGKIPDRFVIFRYQIDLDAGRIRVVREKQRAGADLFSIAFGYVQARVRSREDMSDWLGKVDDVVYADVDPRPNSVLLGGRRYGSARTPGCSLEDIACLYQAHGDLKEKRKAFEKAVAEVAEPLVRRLQSAINAYNAAARAGWGASHRRHLAEAREHIAKIRKVLGIEAERTAPRKDSDAETRPHRRARAATTAPNKDSAAEAPFGLLKGGRLLDDNGDPRAAADILKEMGRGDSLDEMLRRMEERRQRDMKAFRDKLNRDMLKQPIFSGGPFDLALVRAEILNLRTLVRARVTELQQAKVQELHRKGQYVPEVPAPGFSLDPDWNLDELIGDLDLLARDPRAIATRAKESVAELSKRSTDRSTKLTLLSAAEGAAMMGDTAISVTWQQRIRNTAERIRKQKDKVTSSHAIVPFLELQEELKQSLRGRIDLATLLKMASGKYPEKMAIAALCEYITATHQFQKARYDGPLKGTHVGMVLFYGDLLAKLWASVDYGRSAPAEEVIGFLSAPRLNPDLEPEYWAEHKRLPNTRLWFGPKPEGYSLRGKDTLMFAPVATRIFAAGSNPLKPGEETVAAEGSQRRFGWWNHHFAPVADYEPQYHRMNQITKWSMITAMFHERKHMAWLRGERPKRDYRFDRWLNETPELRLLHDVPFVAEEKWPNGCEALPRIRSYSYPSLGHPASYMEGGVSLPSIRSLDAKVIIDTDVMEAIRRGGVNYEASGRRTIQFIKGPLFDLPPVTGRAAVAHATPAKGVRLRSGGVRFISDSPKLATEFQRAGRRLDISLSNNHGQLATATFDRTAGGSVLRVAHGPHGSDVRLAVEAADALVSGTRYGSLPEPLAMDRGVRYVTLDETMLRSLRRPQGETPGASITARRVSDAAEFASTPSPGTIARYGISRKGSRRTRGHLAQSTVSPLRKNAEVDRVLAQYAWQKLALGGTPGGGRPLRRVVPVFTNTGAPKNATPVKIAFSKHGTDPFELDGFVARNTLYVRRAKSGTPKAFHDLVTEYNITPHSLTETIRGATETGRGEFHGPHTKMPSTIPDAIPSDPRQARQLLSVLARMDANALREALARWARCRGQGPLADYIQLSVHHKSFADRLQMTTSGNRAHTELRLQPAELGREMPPTRSEIREADVYVEATGPLSQLDWGATPEHHLQQLARDPAVRWRRVETASWPPCRPSRLHDGAQMYKHVGRVTRKTGDRYLISAPGLKGLTQEQLALRSRSLRTIRKWSSREMHLFGVTCAGEDRIVDFGDVSVRLSSTDLEELATGKALGPAHPLTQRLAKVKANGGAAVLHVPVEVMGKPKAVGQMDGLALAMARAYPETPLFKGLVNQHTQSRSRATRTLSAYDALQKTVVLSPDPDHDPIDCGLIKSARRDLEGAQIRVIDFHPRTSPQWKGATQQIMIIITGHLDKKTVNMVRTQGQKGYFRGNIVLLATCETGKPAAGEAVPTAGELITEINGRYGSQAAFQYKGKVTPQAIAKLLEGLIRAKLRRPDGGFLEFLERLHRTVNLQGIWTISYHFGEADPAQDRKAA